MPKRKLTGTVVSNKMTKTVTVAVETIKKHSKYRKTFKTHKKYKAHANEDYQVGDKVVIEEHKPMSKDKRFIVIKKI